jgi:diguanylate cyclase (GGDEF)-like protein
MESKKQELLADTIGARHDVDARRRFWLAHMRIGFGIFLAETLVVMGYLSLTPTGPHRPLLWWVVASWLAFAVAGLGFAPWIAARPWRSTYSVSWTIASTYAVGLVAIFDGGVTSPILLLLFLTLIFGTLLFTPRSAAVCGASALVALTLVAAVDHTRAAASGRTFMLFASVAGAAVLSVAASVNRSHIERHEETLLAALAGLASTDELTGCAVRRVLRQRMEVEIERSLRSRSPLSLLMVDVDQFKSVNDNFGHVVGDRVLADIGRVLLANVRTFDVASRLGGDEFAVLLPELDAPGAVRVAERILRALSARCEVPVTLSIGVSSLDWSNPTVEHFFDEADMALYQVKRAGRDAIAVRSPGTQAKITP